ncbi:MAG TPA: ACP S-malonyltransferase [Acidimicrobiales bacterium]|nr:ACP S-malonyltransferase [Acidimicrobiales bacterium]
MPHAVIFPGQGAAAPGVGHAWVDHPAWSVVTEAESVLERPLARLLLDADAAELATTRSSQLAVFLTSLVVWDALAPTLDEHPVAFAGHSLGQVTALVAAGALSRRDGFRLAARRADLSQSSADANPGRMAALIGAELDDAQRLTDAVDDLWVANDNAPGQVVVAGTPEAIERAAKVGPDLGIRKLKPLAVGHAFHTPLLADAAAELRPLLDTFTFAEPSAPVVANTDGLPHTLPEEWPVQMSRHLVEPVRWRACQKALVAAGSDTFLEVGPGRVLAGLAKRTVPDVTVHSLSQPDEVAALGPVAQISEVAR